MMWNVGLHLCYAEGTGADVRDGGCEADSGREQAQRGSRERATCGEQQGVLMSEHTTFVAAACAERAQCFESSKVRIFHAEEGKVLVKKKDIFDPGHSGQKCRFF